MIVRGQFFVSDSVDRIQKNVFAEGLEMVWVDGANPDVAGDDPRDAIHPGMVMPPEILALRNHQESECKFRTGLDDDGGDVGQQRNIFETLLNLV